jgi:type I restriction enzyme, S subunit
VSKFEIPHDWTVARLGELSSAIQYGYTAKAQEEKVGPKLLRITDIQDGAVDWDQVPFCRIENSDKSKYVLSNGDLVFARTGATVGKSYLITGAIPDAVFASYLIRVRLREQVDPKYISYFFKSPQYWRQISENSAGIGQPNVNGKKLSQLLVPVAPRDQQKRIVAEIEKQFSRLDEAVANLKRVKANLKRYKAAVLKAAVEGKLTEEWRKRHQEIEPASELLKRILAERRAAWVKQAAADRKKKYLEPQSVNTSQLRELPEEWAWTTVEQLNVATRSCAYGVLQPGEDLEDGIPFVRVGDINDGRVDLNKMKRIAPAIAAQYPRTKLEGGEFLITLVGAIGRTALAPGSLRGANVARAVGVVPLTTSIDAQWVEAWFRNPAKIAEMTSKSHEVARKTLNLEDVRSASVALPPLTEQHRIVAEIERRFSIAAEAEAQIDVNIKRAGRLRQRILHDAFRGTVLPRLVARGFSVNGLDVKQSEIRQ